MENTKKELEKKIEDMRATLHNSKGSLTSKELMKKSRELDKYINYYHKKYV